MVQFNKIAIVSRLTKSEHQAQCQQLVDLLIEKYGSTVHMNESFGKIMNYTKTTSMEQLKNFDLVIAFGGDGTILWTSRYTNKTPLFGINAGHLGFLTASTLEDGMKNLDRVMIGDYILEYCMRLNVHLDDKKLPSALNESYITNKLSAHICQLDLYVDDFHIGKHLLDGVLVSTPVGSTAYALSAGGSIIEPSFKAMQIVPVNSVSRRMRPFVIPVNSTISATIPESFDGEIIILNDGILEGTLQPDSIVKITMAKQQTVFIRFPNYGFFNRLKDKLDF
ncbi:MAG: NAD(+)/NADH kinase [Candidatus Heimdallarchaeota archaeon]|nr:NAD(+)/NADH kinase [Candidatus Heimdallarchaeota archaeon]